MEKKRGISIFLAEALLVAGNMLAFSYIDYCYTNLGHVSAVAMSTGMTVVSIIGFIVSLFMGPIIEKTHSKMGKFRFWLLTGGIVMAVGNILMVLTFSGSASANAVVISIGYCMVLIALDFVCNAKYNLYERMACGDSKLIDQYNGQSYAGGNLGYTIYSLILLSLVAMIGGANENLGFFGTNVIFVILFLIGVIILEHISKGIDADNADLDVPSPTVGQMFKSLAGNGPAIAVFIGGIIKTTCYTLFNFLLVYMCSNVFGDLNYMTIALTVISIVGVIGAMVAPKVISALKGRKRTAIIISVIAAILYILTGITGKNVAAFMVFTALAVLIQSIYDSIEAVLYIDAGEYWYHKTGEDTRAFSMGLQSIGTKIANAIASPLLGVALVSAHFSETAILTGRDATVLSLETGWIPALGLLLLALILGCFHKVSDSEIEVCIRENAAKDAALYGTAGAAGTGTEGGSDSASNHQED